MRFLCTVVFISLFHFANAQNLTGVWKATSDAKIWGEKVKDFQMQIIQTDSLIEALISYKFHAETGSVDQEIIKETIAVSSRNAVHVSKCGCFPHSGLTKKKWNKSSGGIQITEVNHLSCHYTVMKNKSEDGDCCYLDFDLKWSKKGNEEYLEGTALTVANCGDGYVKLKKTGEITPDEYRYIQQNVPESVASKSFPVLDLKPLKLKGIKIPTDPKNLTGVWRGALRNSYGILIGGLELKIVQTDSIIAALITSNDGQNPKNVNKILSTDDNVFLAGENCNCNLIPEFDDDSNNLNRIQLSSDEVAFGYGLKWFKNGNKQYLLGKAYRKDHSNRFGWHNNYNKDDNLLCTDCPGPTDDVFITLEKVGKITPSESSFITANILEKRLELRSEKSEKLLVKDLSNEDDEIVKKIIVNTKEVKLIFKYNQGEVDNRNKFSVYLDRKPLFIDKTILNEPLEIVLEMDKTIEHELIFVSNDCCYHLPRFFINSGNLNEEMALKNRRLFMKNVFIFKYVDLD